MFDYQIYVTGIESGAKELSTAALKVVGKVVTRATVETLYVLEKFGYTSQENGHDLITGELSGNITSDQPIKPEHISFVNRNMQENYEYRLLMRQTTVSTRSQYHNI